MRQRVGGRTSTLAGAVDRDELTLATFNIWNDAKHAEERYLAIAELLSRRAPDIMVFQEVTPAALAVLLDQPWIRDEYLRAAVVGGDVRRLRNADAVPVAPLPRYVYPAAHVASHAAFFKPNSPSTALGRSSAAYTSTAGSRRRGCAAGSCAEYSVH